MGCAVPPCADGAGLAYQDAESFEYWVTEHLRLSGIYWGLTALDMMGGCVPWWRLRPTSSAVLRLDDMDKEAIIEKVLSCRHSNGAGGRRRAGTDCMRGCRRLWRQYRSRRAHAVYAQRRPGERIGCAGVFLGALTCRVFQILILYDALDRLDEPEKVPLVAVVSSGIACLGCLRAQTVAYVAALQQPDVSFAGDESAEIDTRFSYCAANCLSIMGRCGALARQQQQRLCVRRNGRTVGSMQSTGRRWLRLSCAARILMVALVLCLALSRTQA